MANYIDEIFVKQYHDAVMLALQQKGTVLSPYVRQDTLNGEVGFYDFLEPDDDINTIVDDNTSVDTRHPDTVITDPTWTRRMVSAQYFTKAYLIEDRDKIRAFRDPTSEYVQNIAMSMGRKIDKLLLNAALGTAYTGKDGTVAVDLPSTQVVKADFETANTATPLTFEKLMYAKMILDSNNIYPDEKRIIVVNARQIYNLIKDLANTNMTRDAETVRSIAQGDINTYMGFTFVMTNLVNSETVTLTDGTTTATVDDIIAFTTPGLLLAKNKETKARIAERPDKNHAVQVFFGMYVGATRMDEKRVVKIEAAQ